MMLQNKTGLMQVKHVNTDGVYFRCTVIRLHGPFLWLIDYRNYNKNKIWPPSATLVLLFAVHINSPERKTFPVKLHNLRLAIDNDVLLTYLVLSKGL